jgi:hypothetical protein
VTKAHSTEAEAHWQGRLPWCSPRVLRATRNRPRALAAWRCAYARQQKPLLSCLFDHAPATAGAHRENDGDIPEPPGPRPRNRGSTCARQLARAVRLVTPSVVPPAWPHGGHTGAGLLRHLSRSLLLKAGLLAIKCPAAMKKRPVHLYLILFLLFSPEFLAPTRGTGSPGLGCGGALQGGPSRTIAEVGDWHLHDSERRRRRRLGRLLRLNMLRRHMRLKLRALALQVDVPNLKAEEARVPRLPGPPSSPGGPTPHADCKHTRRLPA